eukprot:3493677-Rhodomonas_salina.2
MLVSEPYVNRCLGNGSPRAQPTVGQGEVAAVHCCNPLHCQGSHAGRHQLNSRHACTQRFSQSVDASHCESFLQSCAICSTPRDLWLYTRQNSEAKSSQVHVSWSEDNESDRQIQKLRLRETMFGSLDHMYSV